MRTTSQRMLSLLLALTMLVSLFPAAVSAQEPAPASIYDVRVNDLIAPLAWMTLRPPSVGK